MPRTGRKPKRVRRKRSRPAVLVREHPCNRIRLLCLWYACGVRVCVYDIFVRCPSTAVEAGRGRKHRHLWCGKIALTLDAGNSIGRTQRGKRGKKPYARPSGAPWTGECYVYLFRPSLWLIFIIIRNRVRGLATNVQTRFSRMLNSSARARK